MSFFGKLLCEVVESVTDAVDLGVSLAVDTAALPLALVDPDLVGEPFERTKETIEEIKS